MFAGLRYSGVTSGIDINGEVPPCGRSRFRSTDSL